MIAVTPTLVGKIEIDPAGILSDASMDDPLGAIKLRAGFEEIEGGLSIRA